MNEDNRKDGWIKLYRSVTDNWVFDDPQDFRAWIDLLLMVNHKKKIVKRKGNIVEVDRGQKLTSIRKLSIQWGWGKERTVKFLKQLQSTEMIYFSSDRQNGTLITVRNYADYQGVSNENPDTDKDTDGDTDKDTDKDTTRTRTGTQTRHKQEGKNIKNDKERKNNNKPRPWGGILEPE